MSIEKKTDLTEEDFNKIVNEYKKRKKMLPKKKSHKALNALLGIGLLAGGIGIFGMVKYGSLNDFYQEMKARVDYVIDQRNYSRTGTNDYNLGTSPVIFGHTEEKDMLTQDEVVDEILSGVEVLPGITTGDVVGGSMMDFVENTDPEDMVKEITRGVVREMYEGAVETGKEVVQEVLSDPDVSEAVSGISEGLKSIFGK